MASVAHRIDRLRFEGPLAAMLGLAGGFAAWEAPLDGVAGIAGRAAFAGVAVVVLTPVGWWTLRPRRRIAVGATVAPQADEDASPIVRMRRADRHPDAPMPQPIFASRDLGTPFMAVTRDDTARDPAHDPADAVPIVATTPLEAAAPVPPIAAAAPVDEGVSEPRPVAPVPPVADEAPATGRDSLAAMVDRLARGVERRGGVPPRRSLEDLSRSGRPALREALATLNRLADRR